VCALLAPSAAAAAAAADMPADCYATVYTGRDNVRADHLLPTLIERTLFDRLLQYPLLLNRAIFVVLSCWRCCDGVRFQFP
jgi:hypothetical protein